MYLLLGLLAVIIAGSVADAFVSDSASAGPACDDGDDDGADPAPSGCGGDLLAPDTAQQGGALAWDHDPGDFHPLANGMPAHGGPDASWRDPLDYDPVQSRDSAPPDTAPPVGTGGATLIGGPEDQVLIGGWGDDRLFAGGGNNTLEGGAGDDLLVGAVERAQAGSQNFLNGGTGDDVLIGGGNDVLHGGPGADRFILGDWIGPGASVTIMDYTPGVDRIELAFDPALNPAPDVTTRTDPQDPAHALILLDGEIIARVIGAAGLQPSDIVLVAEHPEPVQHQQG